MYAEMIDGLRGHYEGRLKDKSSAGFQAAMAMSCLFQIFAASLLIIVDAVETGDVEFVTWAHGHKLMLVAFGAATSWAHVQYAKYRNVYHKVGPPESNAWRFWFTAYCCITAVLFVISLVAAYRSG